MCVCGYVGWCGGDGGVQVTPLLVTEFLHRVVDVFRDYFNEVSDESIKENFITGVCVCVCRCVRVCVCVEIWDCFKEVRDENTKERFFLAGIHRSCVALLQNMIPLIVLCQVPLPAS